MPNPARILTAPARGLHHLLCHWLGIYDLMDYQTQTQRRLNALEAKVTREMTRLNPSIYISSRSPTDV